MASAPGFKLTINGTSFTQAGNAGLQELVLEDHVDMVGQLSARFGGSEQDPKWKFKIGDEVEVLFGSYEGNSSAPIFSGEIISIEPGFQHDGQSSVTVRALDKIHRLGRGRKTRHWEEMKDSDVASEVGAESGLSVEVDPTEKVHPYILQRNETNVAFLKRLAARNNFTLRVDDNKLLFKKASFQSQDVDVQSGGNLRSVRMAFNSSDMVQKVVVRGWDPAKKQEIVGMCEASSISPMGSGELRRFEVRRLDCLHHRRAGGLAAAGQRHREVGDGAPRPPVLSRHGLGGRQRQAARGRDGQHEGHARHGRRQVLRHRLAAHHQPALRLHNRVHVLQQQLR
jgi:phage protein D